MTECDSIRYKIFFAQDFTHPSITFNIYFYVPFIGAFYINILQTFSPGLNVSRVTFN